MCTTTPIEANAFCTSIKKALQNPPDANRSIVRIQNTLNSMTEGKLYLSNRREGVYFFTKLDEKYKYLSRHSDQIYPLARRRYQKTLMEILKLTGSTSERDIVRRAKKITELQDFIRACERGNLDIARIILTRNQKRWFTGSFSQKKIDESKALKTARGLPVRSKSERDIIDTCDDFAVPLHYEEMRFVYVKDLVDELYDDLIDLGFIKGETAGRGSEYSQQLYKFNEKVTYWNVPPELEWMNSRGSIWKTYYPPRGTVRMFNDIKSMFADSSLFLWEHEGMMKKFSYRCNASERASVLKLTDAVPRNHLLETYENDVDTPEKRRAIIETRILPFLWF